MDIQTIELWFFIIYSSVGTAAFLIGSYRNAIKRRKEAEASLAAAEDYAADLEEERNELAAGYSTMALALETLQTEMQVLIAHTEGHCQRLDMLEQGRALRIRFMVAPELNYDNYQPEEEPYSESDCPTATPLPDYMNNVKIEGLNEL